MRGVITDGSGEGEPTGVGALLRVFRAAASTTLGRPILQREVADALHRSERWYRDLEGGIITRPLSRHELDTIGTLLGLDRVQRRALFLVSNGGGHSCVEAQEPPRISDELHLLLDQQPFPAYVIDATWNVLAVNMAMAALFPWSIAPGANLMRWLLLSAEARDQHLNWGADAEVCVRMLRDAAVDRPDDPDLQQLISDTCQNPAVGDLWSRGAADFADHYDGHVLQMVLPLFDGQVTELVTHVLHPAGLPGCRMTILTQRSPREPAEKQPVPAK
ncbi:helix-turn-helix transcriptional regulator [Streptomyces sp. ICN988]|uniref:helix-turn-helix transcriptional regulator n=1 Tax=Streptomyces TaxID=1883 RepID=UPI0021E461BE|nr:helix-turn-helix transcriptional regulator [Streptomyces sp. ICN988]MCV2460498.1 helix-turn-helix transcriptional regulator [Streptomyces sp. ICN988]